MTGILSAILTLGLLGLLFGLLLAVSSKIFSVERDEKADRISECLPGANCGACGFAGCSNLAAAISEGKAEVNSCRVGGTECAEKIADIMGVKAEAAAKITAYVKCRGGDRAKRKFNYDGIRDCVAASKVAGGPLECSYGCLGFGTCVSVCEYNAIRIEKGVAIVHAENCKACGKCVKACPRHIISLQKDPKDINISCSSHLKGIYLRKICDIGCLGCSLCAKACPNGAITIEDNLAQIDREKCVSCGACVKVCPRHLISDASESFSEEIKSEKEGSI
ncbi:MAG: RnfABCDGE type electron transport complex subunit B [Clostridia bacterium]|nr:RnfABCDGE type electron transport complex subunit B [Clostridia bacterium]